MEEYYRILRLCAIVKQRKNVPRRCRKLALHDIIFSKYKTLKIFHRKEFFLFFKNEKERFSIWCLQKRKNVENDCFRFSERAQSGASEDRRPPAGACGNAGARWKFFPSGRALRKARVAERPSRPFREQDGLKSCGKARVVRCPECRTGGAGPLMFHPSRLPFFYKCFFLRDEEGMPISSRYLATVRRAIFTPRPSLRRALMSSSESGWAWSSPSMRERMRAFTLSEPT